MDAVRSSILLRWRLRALVQVQEVVTTGKCRPVKNGLRDCHGQYEDSRHNKFWPPAWNSRQNAIKRLGVEQKEWNCGSGEQPSRSKIRMLARWIGAKTKIKGNRQNRHEQDEGD